MTKLQKNAISRLQKTAYLSKMSLCLSRRRVWWFLFSAVLLHEAEGEFAAVGGGDGEEVGARRIEKKNKRFISFQF